MDAEQKPLAEILFGPETDRPQTSENGLAEAISVWFRAKRFHVSDAGQCGTRSEGSSSVPRRRTDARA
jgi:hypothetical protein